MAVEFNHTIVHARDKIAGANFLSEILGLPSPEPFYHFMVVKAANGVSLDYLATDGPIEIAHYAFLVSEAEFDDIWGRIKARGLDWYADPMRSQKGEINRHDGGRGLYFTDPSGHVMEIITRPYGSGG